MKKLFALILCLCMLTSAVPVLAQGAYGVGWKITAEADTDHFIYLLQSLWMNMGMEGSDEMLDGAETLLSLMNAASFEGEAGTDTVRMRLTLKEQTVLEAAAGVMADGGWGFQTNLLSGCMLVLPGEQLNRLMNKLSDMLAQIGPAELMNTVIRLEQELDALLARVKSDLDAKIVSDTQEQITKEVQGESCTYDRVTVYRIAGKDVYLAMQKLMNGTMLLLKDLLVSIGVPREEISIRLSEESLPEDDAFGRMQILATHYRAESGQAPDFWVMETEAEGEKYYIEALTQLLAGGEAQKAFRMYRYMDGEEITMLSLKTKAGATEEEDYSEVLLDVMGTVYLMDVRNYGRMDGGTDTLIRFYLNSLEKPLGTLEISRWPLTSAPIALSADGMQLVDVTAAMDENVKTMLKTSLQKGFGDVLIRMIMAAPDEMEEMMNRLQNVME